MEIINPLDPYQQKVINTNWKYQDLLIPVMKKGKVIYKSPKINQIRANTIKELKKFHMGILRLINPHYFPVGLEKHLYAIKDNLIAQLKK